MKKNEPATLFILLINPFLSFLLALRNLTKTQNCIVFLIFAALWGWSMSFEYTPCDNYRIAAVFCHRHFSTFEQVWKYQEDGKSIDIYLHVINLLVHKVSNNAKAFFAVLSLIYGFFMMASFRYMLMHRVNGKSQYLNLIMVLMFFTVSISNTAMPRYWTAAWCLTFVMMNMVNGNYKWIPFLIILPYVHFSFLPVVIVLVFAVFFSDYFFKHEKQLFIIMVFIFFVSFFLSEGVLSYIIPDQWFNGEKTASKYNAYVNTGRLKGRAVYQQASAYRQANSMITTVFQYIMKIGSFCVIYFVYKHRAIFQDNRKVRKLFTFVLMLASICYFMSIVRMVGWRYVWLLWLSIYYLLYVVYDLYRPKFIRKYSPLLIPMSIYSITFTFYLAYRCIDFRLFWQPLYNIIVNGLDFPPVNLV